MQDPKGYKSEEEFYSRQGKLDVKRPIRRRYLWPLIACIALLLAVVFASTTIYLLVNHALGTPVGTVPQTGIATPMVPTQIPPTLVPTAPPVTPSPIPTPQVIQINQTMTCVCATDAGNFNFSLIVRNATIDRAKVQVTLLIGLQNNSSNATGAQLQFIRFQDQQTGETIDGVGEGFSSTQFAPNQLILFRPTFQFVPVAGHKYSLSAELAGTFDFSPITITF